MVKGVATLIRINEWTVDERRRELGARLKELDDLETALDRLEKEVVDEQRAAAARAQCRPQDPPNCAARPELRPNRGTLGPRHPDQACG